MRDFLDVRIHLLASPSPPMCHLFLVVVSGKRDQDALCLVDIIGIPWLQAKDVHELGPATVRLDDFPLSRSQGRCCSSVRWELFMRVKRHFLLRASVAGILKSS